MADGLTRKVLVALGAHPALTTAEPTWFCTGCQVAVAHEEDDRDPRAVLREHQAEAVAAVVQDEVERLRGELAQVTSDRDVLRTAYARLGGRQKDDRAALVAQRPRITTTWGEPDGIGGPQKGAPGVDPTAPCTCGTCAAIRADRDGEGGA